MKIFKDKKGQVAAVAGFAGRHWGQILISILLAIGLLLYWLNPSIRTYINFYAIFIAFILVNIVFIGAYYYLVKLAVKGILKFKVFAKRIQYYWSIIFK